MKVCHSSSTMLLVISLLLAATLFSLLLVGIGLWLRRRRRARIAARAWMQWERLPAIADPSRRLLEAESILDHALLDCGYSGTFGEKLQRLQRVLSNVDAVWHAHKLRNRIAHEPGTHVSEEEAKRAIATFERVLKTLLSL